MAMSPRMALPGTGLRLVCGFPNVPPHGDGTYRTRHAGGH